MKGVFKERHVPHTVKDLSADGNVVGHRKLTLRLPGRSVCPTPVLPATPQNVTSANEENQPYAVRDAL